MKIPYALDPTRLFIRLMCFQIRTIKHSGRLDLITAKSLYHNVTSIFMHRKLMEYGEKVLCNEEAWNLVLARRYKPSADEHRKLLVKLYTQMPVLNSS